MEPPRAAMSAPRVGRCLRCDLELPFVAFSRSQQNKLRAKKPATCIRCCDNRPSPEELEQQQKGRAAHLLGSQPGWPQPTPHRSHHCITPPLFLTRDLARLARWQNACLR